MIVFDTEDDSAELLAAGKSGFGKQVTQIAAICDNGQKFWNEGDPNDFLKWCHQQGTHDLWAFNCQYDIGNLCNDPEKMKLDDFDKVLVKSRFIRGQVKGLKFFDVGNIAGAGNSIGKLGLAVGLPKFGFKYSEKEFTSFPKKEQVKYIKFAGMEKAELFRNKEYVFRDCEIPMRWLQIVQEMCTDMGIDKIPATLGGLCVSAFAAQGGSNWHEATETSKAALIGARVEIFNTGGTGRIAYTDINSLYPWCMTQLFPESMEPMTELTGYGIAYCDVDVPEMFIAPLPWRDEEGRLLFPTGKFSGVWTIHEINNAVKHGATVLKTHWILGSKTGKPYYRDYIVDKYEKRLKSRSETEKLFWKLLMNNLYGRLAIGGEISRSMLLTPDNRAKGIPYGKKVLVSHKMPLPEFSNYLHAVYVLSYARIRLFEHLKKIPEKDLIYCDTDSAFFFCPGELPFSVGTELGMMKLEKMGSRAIPVLPKTYIFDGEYKAKGVPKRCAKVFIETGTAEYDAPFKMRESITFYEQNNKRKLSVWRNTSKDLNATYDKKRKNGIFFLPIQINRLDSNLRTRSKTLLAVLTT